MLRYQYQAQTLTLGKVNWCQGGGGGFPLQLQHPGDHGDSLHYRPLHPRGGCLPPLQSEGFEKLIVNQSQHIYLTSFKTPELNPKHIYMLVHSYL